MQIMQNVARRYGLVCLLHEKPFAGVNGSGKHNNWSMGTDTGINLLEPGDTPHENLQFLFFCSAVIAAVDKYQTLLRASIASHGQDHRLGANEAPPAIISIFLGAELERIYDAIESGSGDAATPAAFLELGTSVLPHLPMHGGDRNRTSPFAFTGNKFEFRAVGSSASPALPNTVLNTIVADAIDTLTDAVQVKLDGGASLEEGVLGAIKDSYAEHKKILFSGDNYTEEWHTEAEARGLANLAQTPDALPVLVEDSTVDVFSRYNVLTDRELHARYEVFVEQYVTRLNIEAETASTLARTSLLPAALQYLALLDDADEGRAVEALTKEAVGLTDEFVDAIFALEKVNAVHEGEEGSLDHAELRPDPAGAGDGGRARGRRPAGEGRAGLDVAAAEVLGDPLHQVAGAATRPELRKPRTSRGFRRCGTPRGAWPATRRVGPGAMLVHFAPHGVTCTTISEWRRSGALSRRLRTATTAGQGRPGHLIVTTTTARRASRKLGFERSRRAVRAVDWPAERCTRRSARAGRAGDGARVADRRLRGRGFAGLIARLGGSRDRGGALADDHSRDRGSRRPVAGAGRGAQAARAHQHQERPEDGP